MKQLIMRSVFVAAALVATGAASANNVTATSAGTSILSSTDTFAWSSTITGLFGALGIAVTPNAPSTYISPTVTSTTKTFSYDGTTNAITSLTENGGFALTLAAAGFAGGPGQLSFSNIKLDVGTKIVSADVTGANGLAAGTYDLFNVATIGGVTSYTGAGTYATTASGLTITNGGADVLLKGLGLLAFAKGTLTSTADYGSLSFNTTLSSAAAVPEPSTYMLMIMGFGAVAAVRRARRKD